MVLTVYILAAVIWAITAYETLRHELHMFQQSGYKIKTYFLRTFEKPKAFLPYPLLVAANLAALVVYRYGYGVFGVMASALACGIFAFFMMPKPAKKPLVWTARVKRLAAVCGVLLLASALLPAFLLPRYAGELWSGRAHFICAFVTALTPCVVSLACVINSPMEKAINNKYINEARRILADMPNLTVVGVTGSYGKTSVKNYLAALLSAKYNTLATPENYNTTLGVVRTVRERLKPTHEVFVCEMGARHVGDIKEICELVHPDCGIITAVGEQHLETFGSRENIRRTKYELADAIPPEGGLFVNIDSDGISAEPPRHGHFTYGLGEGAEWRGEVISVSRKGSAFRVTSPDGETAEFETPLIGAHNVQNLVGAIACAHSLGVPLEDMRRPLRRLEAVEHRMQLIPRGDVTVIDDAYNSNPAGAAVALETLGLFEAQRILVTPGMVELGEREKELNRELGERAAAHCDAVALVGANRAAPIKEGLLAAGFDEGKIYVAPSLDDAMKWVYALPGAEKVILLENDLPDNY